MFYSRAQPGGTSSSVDSEQSIATTRYNGDNAHQYALQGGVRLSGSSALPFLAHVATFQRHSYVSHDFVRSRRRSDTPASEYTPSTGSESPSSSSVVVMPLLTCEHCGFSTDSHGTMTTHLRVHIEACGIVWLKCEHCEFRTTQEAGIVAHMLTHGTYDTADSETDESFSCDACGFHTSSSFELRAHLATHARPQPPPTVRQQQRQYTSALQCLQCDFVTSDRQTLAQHALLHTRSDTPPQVWHCTRCDHRASDASELRRHMWTHTGKKSYVCTTCGYNASQKSVLTAHERLHTGEKPFACPHCDYRARQNNALTRHMRVHTGEKIRSSVQLNSNVRVPCHGHRHWWAGSQEGRRYKV